MIAAKSRKWRVKLRLSNRCMRKTRWLVHSRTIRSARSDRRAAASSAREVVGSATISVPAMVARTLFWSIAPSTALVAAGCRVDRSTASKSAKASSTRQSISSRRRRSTAHGWTVVSRRAWRTRSAGVRALARSWATRMSSDLSRPPPRLARASGRSERPRVLATLPASSAVLGIERR